MMSETNAWISDQLAQDAERDSEGFVANLTKLAQRPEIIVPIPSSLKPPARAGYWDERAYRDAQHLYRVVALLGSHGVMLRHLKYTLGSVTFQDAQKVLRRSGAVVETKELRRTSDGRLMNLVVLRTAEHGVRDEDEID